DIAPSRKVDPNPTFPWKLLAEEGFGLWYDEEVAAPEIIIDGRPGVRLEIPAEGREITSAEPADTTTTTFQGVDPELALRIIGYDTSNLEAAIKAFKLHFIQSEIDTNLTEQDLKILD